MGGDNLRFRDGTNGLAGQRNWHFWEKTESDVVVDGVTYDKYTYRTADSVTGDEAIYIQQGVNII